MRPADPLILYRAFAIGVADQCPCVSNRCWGGKIVLERHWRNADFLVLLAQNRLDHKIFAEKVDTSKILEY